METIYISGTNITLGQLLKLTNLFDSGGFIKHFLNNEGVYVNGELEHRRGRKIYPNDKVQIDEDHIFIVRMQK